MSGADDATQFVVDGTSYVRMAGLEAWAVLAISAAVIGVGWYGGVDWATGRLWPDWPATTPWTAILFSVLATASLLARPAARLAVALYTTATALARLFAILTLAGVDAIRTPLGTEVLAGGGPAPGLPSVLTLVVVCSIGVAGIQVVVRRAPATRTMLLTAATIVATASAVAAVFDVGQTGSAYGFSIITAVMALFAVTGACGTNEHVAPAVMYRKRPMQTITRVGMGILVCIPIVAFIQTNSATVPPDGAELVVGLVLLCVAAGGACWFGWVDFEAQGWKHVADCSSDAVLVVGADGRISRANGHCLRVTGWSVSELTGRNIEDLIHPNLRSQHRNLVEAYLLNPSRQLMGARPIQMYGPDGSEHLAIIRLIPVVGPDGLVVHVALSDATRESQLRQKALRDPLTDVLNRDGITRYLEAELAGGRGAGVLFVDLDNLKSINDDLSHAAGDEALRAISGAIGTRLRGRDRIGRLGGDAFACVITEVQDAAVLHQVIERILDATRSVTVTEGTRDVGVSVSIGAAIAPAGTNADTAPSCADSAMYTAKRRGGNGSHFADVAG